LDKAAYLALRRPLFLRVDLFAERIGLFSPHMSDFFQRD
jgi:hypothetical protein